MIRNASSEDAKAIARIYNHYIANTVITFEETELSSSDIAERLAENALADLPWFVAERDEKVVGYAYASKWKGRCAYRYSVEATVYLSPDVTGQGFGTKLYEMLFSELKARSFHAVIGGIALPNEASVALHETMGMKKVAHFNEVGFKEPLNNTNAPLAYRPVRNQ
ncbi:MAG: N-acetyltransferase family protein, partial [Cellvibrionaceae bacterium]